MAIRIQSKTPQQREASAETFGYIRAYSSPLEGVKLADPGRGLQQAAQSASQIAQLMQRKQDEAGRLQADKDYNEYLSILTETNDGLKNAYDTRDEQKQVEFEAKFDAINPESKDFVLGTSVDKKYYEPYYADLITNYKKHAIAHKNAKNQYKIRDEVLDLTTNGDTEIAKFRLKPKIGANEYGAMLNKVVIAGTSSTIEALTDERSKSTFRSGMSDNARSIFMEEIRRADSLEGAEAVRTRMLQMLSVPGGLNTFFSEVDQRAVETFIDNAKVKMTANDNEFLRTKAEGYLDQATTIKSQLLSRITSLDSDDLVNGVRDLREAWENIDGTHLSEAKLASKASIAALIGKHEPIIVPPLLATTQLAIDVKGMTKDPNYVIPIDDTMTSGDATAYRDYVKGIVDNGLEAMKNGGGTDGLKILLGKDYRASTAKDDAAALGFSNVSLISLPSGDIPDITQDPIGFKTWSSSLYELNPNNPAAIAHYGAYLRNKGKDEKTRNAGYLLELMSNRANTGADPLTLSENSVMFANKLAKGSGTFSDKEEAEWLKFLKKADKETTHEMPILREIRYAAESGDEGRRKFYTNMLKGVWVENYRKIFSGADKFLDGLGKRDEVYNATFTFDATTLSYSNGFIGNTDDASGMLNAFSTSGHIPVRVPAVWSDNLNYRISLMHAFKGTMRAIGGTDTFQYFMSNFGEGKHVIDNLARDAGLLSLYWVVQNGDIDYQGFTQKAVEEGYDNPILNVINDYGDDIDLGKLTKKTLFEVLVELKVTDASGVTRSAIELMDDGQAADGSMGRVVGIWSKDEDDYIPLVFKDNTEAIVPHSYYNEKLDVLARTFDITSMVDPDESSRIKNREIIPFYSIGAGPAYLFLEKDRLGEEWDYDVFKKAVSDAEDLFIQNLPINPGL